MSGNFGSIIRLIDVVLALFFGFISIADLQPNKRMDLRHTSEESETVSQDQLLYTIYVKPDDTFIVETKGPNIDSKEQPIKSLGKLEKFLLAKVVNDSKSVVKIDPEDKSTVQQSISVLDLCKKYRISNAALDVS